MPRGMEAKLGHQDILTYEEFLRVVRAAASEGMTKVRVTGGEPLVRKGLLDFISGMSVIPGLMDLRLTTNGVLLADMAGDLLAAGIRRVNISLDSLRPEIFASVTGRDEFERVWQGIHAALDAGFDRAKLNMVPLRGINDDELMDFALLTRDLPIEVRFIEFMPLGRAEFWSPEQMVTVPEIKERLAPL
ncbi:MAG: radical SAM protein, partial [Proteobacteria bacterium]|nr:radical SAM protein [Pseudomonadota bacterium]